ncbi:AT-rich interactive domain-containing protein 5B-like [Clupea harengus]|uniref:AT-rich interactive domain-containing protein 5B-like n=1 Tax=Clupea harengus TaxID=7950 RepID=A0A6P8G5I3_CLUHA|nr:AT-rich interactive domain-containing protein 5B-like [Clupea harengus]
METDSLKWVGSPCGLHGPYIFYKAFKFHRDGKARILSLGDFFLVRCTPEDPICIAELQLLWEERTTKQLLSSSKLYFLPEDTPSGRTVNHGEDEVIGVSEKVILRLEDLVKWTLGDLSGWVRGMRAVSAVTVATGVTVVPKTVVLRELATNGHRDPHLGGSGHRPTHTHLGGSGHRPTHTHLSSRFSISFRDVLREKAQIGEDEEERMKVLVLSYPQYCRYRCVLARLRGGSQVAVVTDHIVRALGGIGPLHGDVRILYCRETFQHPTLGHNESVCEHFAPNLKGRPRKRKLSQRRDSQNQDSNQNQNPNQTLQTGPQSRHPASTSPELRPPAKARPECRVVAAKVKNGGMCKRVSAEEKREERKRERKREDKEDKAGTEGQKTDEQAFLVALYKYMKKRKTPIERIPYLGFKQINLWMMFQTAQKLGGYEQITAHRQWKHVYDELGGHPGSTSAATCTRRHYERLLLPYERYSQGQEERPGVEPRPIKAESVEPCPIKAESVEYRPTRAESVESCPIKAEPVAPHSIKAEPVESCPIRAEPVSIEGSEDKDSSSRCPKAGPAPNQQPQRDTGPQNSAVLEDRGGFQHSLHFKDVGSKNTKKEEEVGEEEEEEELQVTVKQEETLPTQARHHDNHRHHPADPIHTDLILQTDQKHPPSSPPDPPGRLCQQEGGPSRSSGLPTGASLAPQALWQATAPGRHSVHPLGVLELGEAGRVSEHEGQLVGPVKETAEGSPPEALHNSRGCERSSPNAHGAPYFSGPHSVMSPLAKKKLLSQVCVGGAAPQNYPTAPPPAAARSDVGQRASCGRGVTSMLDPVRQGPRAHPASPETAPAPRPSVIQHAQSFRPFWSADEERTTPGGSESSCPRGGEAPLRGQFLPCPPPFSQHSFVSDRTEPQERVQRPWEKPSDCGGQVCYSSPHLPSDLRGEVCYSSPHLQSLYRHTKHRLSQQQQQHRQQQQHLSTQVYPSRDGQGVYTQVFPSRDGECGQRRGVAGLTQNAPDVVIDERYSTPPPLPPQLGCHRGPAATNSPAVDQPADLSFPKVLSKGAFGIHTYPTMHGDCRLPAPIQPGLDAHGIACKGFPVPVGDGNQAYKASVRVGISGTGGFKHHTSESVRAAKRPLEDPERTPPAKTRLLSPLHPSKDAPVSSGGCPRVSERQGEEAEPPEPARAVHLNSYSSQGHRYPPHAPHLGGLCPVGMFGVQEACEGPRTVGYPPSHPLAFLKSQGGAMPSVVAPPFVLHALMMQGQLVRTSTASPLYQASAVNRGGRFSEPMPHGLYPLRPFNPLQAYHAPQMPTVQPSTKL